MEFKARKITVEQSDPYREDRLSRKEHIDNVSLLLRNFSTPIVISINAPWGQGKTTFMEMLHANLLNESCNAIYFSAWETDFASDPLLAFLGEVNHTLESLTQGDTEKSEAWTKAKKAGTHIFKKGIPALIKVGTAGVIDVDKMLEDEASKLMEGFSKDLIEQYSKSKNEIQLFKDSIAEILNINGGCQRKLYILIDELDRCRPTYAIEFLERIKHLLDIEGLVFVLALDKEQLSHSVKGIYGADFEAIGYLRRFIDIEYTLPDSNLNDFINKLYETFDFDSFFKRRTKYRAFQYENEHIDKVLKMLFSALKLSLRDVEQIFAKMNLVLHSTKENTYLYPSLLAFLLVVKEHDRSLYREYILEESSPEDMIAFLHKLVPNHIQNESFECALVEGYLIAAKHQRYNSNLGNSLQRHKDFLADENSDDLQKRYSERILHIVSRPVDVGNSVSLKSLVNRIEMTEQFSFT